MFIHILRPLPLPRVNHAVVQKSLKCPSYVSGRQFPAEVLFSVKLFHFDSNSNHSLMKKYGSEVCVNIFYIPNKVAKELSYEMFYIESFFLYQSLLLNFEKQLVFKQFI